MTKTKRITSIYSLDVYNFTRRTKIYFTSACNSNKYHNISGFGVNSSAAYTADTSYIHV